MQGWYTRENILANAAHPDGNKERLSSLASVIEKVNGWNDAIQPEKLPFFTSDGAIIYPERVEDVCKILQMLFKQYLGMNDRLNVILDNPEPLHARKTDFQYIVACMGWVYYAINHAVDGDKRFAERFNDRELLQARQGDAEASQQEIEFVNYLFQSFNDEATYNPQTCQQLTEMIEIVMNETMKESVTTIDKYLSFFG